MEKGCRRSLACRLWDSWSDMSYQEKKAEGGTAMFSHVDLLRIP